ncbi:MAG: ATP-binding protein, partial [Candidatus Pacebacteria bacterium]|nr:ATP-binding protein [Candidatus Paceibacterota bacterium]
MKEWEQIAIKLLEKSLIPLPQEINELDWKVDISEKGNRMARHLSAFSNYSGGGFLVFGVSDDGGKVGVEKDQCNEIVKKIGNIARDGV